MENKINLENNYLSVKIDSNGDFYIGDYKIGNVNDSYNDSCIEYRSGIYTDNDWKLTTRCDNIATISKDDYITTVDSCESKVSIENNTNKSITTLPKLFSNIKRKLNNF